MAVRYKRIDGELVSEQWYAVLSSARSAGVHFHVNEGHRTLARQWYFYRGWIAHKPGFNLAAYPSPNAPHIRTGRIDHAIDVEQTDGGAQRLASWMRKHGVPAYFTVGGEPWHIESTAGALQHYFDGHKGGKDHRKLLLLSKAERHAVERRYYHYDQLQKEKKSGKGPKYLSNLAWSRWWQAKIRSYMRAVQRAARAEHNWKKYNRDQRYQILGAGLEHKLDL